MGAVGPGKFSTRKTRKRSLSGQACQDKLGTQGLATLRTCPTARTPPYGAGTLDERAQCLQKTTTHQRQVKSNAPALKARNPSTLRSEQRGERRCCRLTSTHKPVLRFSPSHGQWPRTCHLRATKTESKSLAAQHQNPSHQLPEALAGTKHCSGNQPGFACQHNWFDLLLAFTGQCMYRAVSELSYYQALPKGLLPALVDLNFKSMSKPRRPVCCPSCGKSPKAILTDCFLSVYQALP